MSNIKNDEIRVLMEELDNEYGQDKLQYLKKEGHGSFYISTKAIEEKFYKVIEQKALSIYQENKNNNRLIEKYTKILEQESCLALSVIQRNEINNLIQIMAFTYDSRELNFEEIQFLKAYYSVKDLHLSSELRSLAQQKVSNKTSDGKSNTITTALTGMALVGEKLQREQIAEDISSIVDNTSNGPTPSDED